MAAPFDRKSLHARRTTAIRKTSHHSTAAGDLEGALDALLHEAEKTEHATGGVDSDSSQAPSPIELLRDLFRESLIPQMNEIAERYRAKGVDLHVDASDFLEGGRGVIVDITYGERRTVLEGTVMPDKIAFSRASYVGGVGGTMSSGPSLRTANLDAKRFGDFVYGKIIALVRDTNGR